LAELSGVAAIETSLNNGVKMEILREIVSSALILRLPMDIQVAGTAARLSPSRVIIETALLEGEDLELVADNMEEIVALLGESSAEVGIAIEPELDQVKSCYARGAHFILLKTTGYQQAGTLDVRSDELYRIENAVTLASKLGLRIHFGDDLSCHDLASLSSFAEVEMYHVGSSIFSRATALGLGQALKDAGSALERGGQV